LDPEELFGLGRVGHLPFRRRRRIYSPNLHTKLKPIKNHVMDGYQKGHMTIQASGLKDR